MGNVPMPKQFLTLNDKAIIIHTLEKFMLNNRIDVIYIAVPKEWVQYTKDLIKKHQLNIAKVQVIEGGAERNETIMQVVHTIEQQFGLQEEDILLTHDAVRPFLTHRIINENIDAGLEYGSVDTVISAIDTIVDSEDGEFISAIPVRDRMFQGQTPQTFNMMKLKELYSTLSEEEKAILTDACKIFALKDEKVKLVRGESFNIKVTTPYDLNVANAILKGSLDR